MGSDLNNLSVVDKAEALFGYLEEFSKIRMKIVRNVSDYASDCLGARWSSLSEIQRIIP